MKGIILSRATPSLSNVSGNDPHIRVSVTIGDSKIIATNRIVQCHCWRSATSKPMVVMPYSGKATENAITPRQNAADGEIRTPHDQRCHTIFNTVKPRPSVCHSITKSTITQSGANQSQCQPKPNRRGSTLTSSGLSSSDFFIAIWSKSLVLVGARMRGSASLGRYMNRPSPGTGGLPF